jgi:hypothetical protein
MRSKTLCVAVAATVAASGTAAQLATATTTKTIPKAELIKRGDAICKKGNRRITLTPPSGDPAHITPDQLRAAAPFLRQELRVNAAEVRQVAALGMPDRDKATFKRAIALSRQMLRWVRKEVAAAEAGDVAAFHVAMRHDSGQAASQTLARFGFRVCGR